MKILLSVLMVFTMGSYASSQQSQSPADVIFINGDIYTGVGDATAITRNGTLPPFTSNISRRSAQALAITAGKIVTVGSNDEIHKLKGP
ncbi:MAG TPA: hypothetical protein VGQ12_14850, partial [Candidatus Angelobacter sp.]|nr:hypothetical protein [Candidatus Angelobacter sp.]